MKALEMANQLGYALATKTVGDADIIRGYTSDLLSDIMGNAGEGSILITIQAHKNTVAVAVLVGAAAILICNNREIPLDMLEAAEKEGVLIFKTTENQFESSYQIHRAISGF